MMKNTYEDVKKHAENQMKCHSFNEFQFNEENIELYKLNLPTHLLKI